jgi:preprotein translocase subunit SecD
VTPTFRASPRGLAQPGRLRVYDWEANVRDARCRPEPTSLDVTSGGAAGQPGAGSLSRAAAAARAARCPGSRAVRAPDGHAWYVLRDRPALTSRDVADARVAGDRLVTVRFTPDVRARWQTLTGRIAARGRARQRAGVDPLEAAQHVAIALDDRLLITFSISPRGNPHGLDGLEISSVGDPRTLVALLKSGALPARLATTAP